MRTPLLAPVICFYAFAAVNVTTQHNDNSRTGANLDETELTPDLLSSGRFGKLFSLCVNGQVYAQPLVVTGVSIAGGTHDVVYAATMENNVYAFDATGKLETPFWHKNLGPPVGYNEIAGTKLSFNIRPWIGITSTPVIDVSKYRLYVVAKIRISETDNFFRLFSIDMTDGRILAHADVTAYVDGKPVDQFAFSHAQRPSLLLSNGHVYIGFGSHQDAQYSKPFSGWVLGYSADDYLKQDYAFPVTPGSSGRDGGGIWQAGNGLAADKAGNVYFMTGDGEFNNRTQFANSFVKLSPDLQISSWFTPANYRKLQNLDIDLGSAGPMLIPDVDPDIQQLVGGGKDGRFFLLDRKQLGGVQQGSLFGAKLNPPIQFFQATARWHLTWLSWFPLLWHAGYHHIHGSPVYWRRDRGALVYVWGEEDNLRAYPYDPQNHFDVKHVIKSDRVAPNGMPGGILSLSANKDTNGILWTTLPLNDDGWVKVVRGVLRAFDAKTLKELWSTEQWEPHDNFDFAKFCPPTIANGKVYLPTFSDRLNVYGKLPVSAPSEERMPKMPKLPHKHPKHRKTPGGTH